VVIRRFVGQTSQSARYRPLDCLSCVSILTLDGYQSLPNVASALEFDFLPSPAHICFGFLRATQLSGLSSANNDDSQVDPGTGIVYVMFSRSSGATMVAIDPIQGMIDANFLIQFGPSHYTSTLVPGLEYGLRTVKTRLSSSNEYAIKLSNWANLAFLPENGACSSKPEYWLAQAIGSGGAPWRRPIRWTCVASYAATG